jgi:hypothetical protein
MDIDINTIKKVTICRRCFTWSNQQIADWCRISIKTVNRILFEDLLGKKLFKANYKRLKSIEWVE